MRRRVDVRCASVGTLGERAWILRPMMAGQRLLEQD